MAIQLVWKREEARIARAKATNLGINWRYKVTVYRAS